MSTLWMRTDIISREDEKDVAGKVDHDYEYAVLAESIAFEIGHYKTFN